MFQPVKLKASSSFLNMLGVYGLLLVFAGGVHLLPLLALPFYSDELVEGAYIAAPAGCAIFIGFMLNTLQRIVNRRRDNQDSQISAKHAAVLVSILWFSSALISAVPYMISCHLDFTEAFFEGMSGWTTTNMTVIGPEPLPHVLVLCRSVTNFFGGVGLTCVVLSTFSEAYGMQLFKAEGHPDRLLPNLAKSARMVMSLFGAYFAVGTIAYVIAGMPVFDAINFCLTAISTGGVSINGMSIDYYQSVPIEVITIVLMILGAMSFPVHLMFIKRKFRSFLKIGELRCFALLLVVGALIISLEFMHSVTESAGEALRLGIYNTVSIITTSGFYTMPAYSSITPLAIATIIFLMLVGGSAGSTAGGIKIGRLYFLYKSLIWRIKRRFMSEYNAKEQSIYSPQGKIYLKEEHYSEVFNYVSFYFVFLFIGVLILTAHGYSLQDSLYDFASAMGTVGLSSGIASSAAPRAVLWTMSFGMFLGRLEIIVVILAIIQMLKGAGNAFRKTRGDKR